MARGRVTVRDRGHDALLQQIRLTQGRKYDLQIGIPDDVGDRIHDAESGLTISELGAIHELGLGVPQRSFIGGWYDENRDRVLARVRQASADFVVGRTKNLELSLRNIARLYGEEMKARMNAGISPELADATVEKKRRKGAPHPETPLEDTLVLRDSIEGKLVIR